MYHLLSLIISTHSQLFFKLEWNQSLHLQQEITTMLIRSHNQGLTSSQIVPQPGGMTHMCFINNRMYIISWNLNRFIVQCIILKGQYRHDQSRLSRGHGITVSYFKMTTVTENYCHIYAAATVIWHCRVVHYFRHWVNLKLAFRFHALLIMTINVPLSKHTCRSS